MEQEIMNQGEDFQNEPNQAEDLPREELVEETEEPTESLESLFGEVENYKPDEQVEEPQQSGQKEPGYVKSRIEKAVQKAVAETEARMQAKFDAQMAPYREQMLTNEAQELVRSGKVKDIETAKELVRYRQGQPASVPQNESDPATMARIDMLKHQADRIKDVNVIAEFQRNEDVKRKVISGEMDFYDVAEMMRQPKKRPPSPMRSPNGVAMNPNAIDSMSDEQFARMEKRIKEGARYSLK